MPDGFLLWHANVGQPEVRVCLPVKFVAIQAVVKPGDEVIGVAAGFPTTVNPILQFG